MYIYKHMLDIVASGFHKTIIFRYICTLYYDQLYCGETTCENLGLDLKQSNFEQKKNSM